MNGDNANGIVYVLTNPAMPGLTKIGMTTQEGIALRLNQLYTTGVPLPFECVFACQVKDCDKVEKAFHFAFGNVRVNPKREFFRVEPERVIEVLRLLSVQDVTPQVEQGMTQGLDSIDRESLEDYKRSRRPNMNFTEMQIPVGGVLLHRDGSTEVTVADARHVNHNGEVRSLTAATKDIMGLGYSVWPAPHWTYNGKTLREIYEETYSDEED